MVPTRPSPSRIRIAKEIGGLSVTITARRHWGLILFLSFWLCGWVMGESFALKTLIGGEAAGEGIGAVSFLVIWLAIWTLGGLAAWYAWLWSLTGEETIVVGRHAMSIRRSVLGIGRATLLGMRTVRNLRAVASQPTGFRRGRVDRIEVETDGRTFSFGADLTESEADFVIDAIRSEVDIPDGSPAVIFEPAAIPA